MCGLCIVYSLLHSVLGIFLFNFSPVPANKTDFCHVLFNIMPTVLLSI
jgi:hypothetical protein